MEAGLTDAARELEALARGRNTLSTEAKVAIFQNAIKAVGINAKVVKVPGGIQVRSEDGEAIKLAERLMNEASRGMATMGARFNGSQFLEEFRSAAEAL